MRHRIGLLAVLAMIVAAAFAAGAWWSRGTLDAPGVGDGAGRDVASGSTPGAPVVALDPESVDLGPDAGLVVDWGALSPPDAALPAPGGAVSRPVPVAPTPSPGAPPR